MAPRWVPAFAMAEHSVLRECDIVRMHLLTVLVRTLTIPGRTVSGGWQLKSPRRVVIPCQALHLRQHTDHKYLAGVTNRRSVAPLDGTACVCFGTLSRRAEAPVCCQKAPCAAPQALGTRLAALQTWCCASGVAAAGRCRTCSNQATGQQGAAASFVTMRRGAGGANSAGSVATTSETRGAAGARHAAEAAAAGAAPAAAVPRAGNQLLLGRPATGAAGAAGVAALSCSQLQLVGNPYLQHHLQPPASMTVASHAGRPPPPAADAWLQLASGVQHAYATASGAAAAAAGVQQQSRPWQAPPFVRYHMQRVTTREHCLCQMKAARARFAPAEPVTRGLNGRALHHPRCAPGAHLALQLPPIARLRVPPQMLHTSCFTRWTPRVTPRWRWWAPTCAGPGTSCTPPLATGRGALRCAAQTAR